MLSAFSFSQRKEVREMNETKTKLMDFWVSESEWKIIEEKMKLCGISKVSSYLRKMAVDGYVINLNLNEISELQSLMKRTSANINQIAKRVNITGNIYADELEEIRSRQDEIMNLQKKMLAELSRIS